MPKKYNARINAAASLCCIGPLLFVVLGLGAFGASAFFETLRPYLLGVATLMLAFTLSPYYAGTLARQLQSQRHELRRV